MIFRFFCPTYPNRAVQKHLKCLIMAKKSSSIDKTCKFSIGFVISIQLQVNVFMIVKYIKRLLYQKNVIFLSQQDVIFFRL